MPLRARALGAALVALCAVACDDAATPGGPEDANPADMRPDPDIGLRPDASRPDTGPPPDSGPPPDAAPPDAEPDAAPPTPGAPGVVAGGAQRATDRFQMTVTVGGPAPTTARQSPRYRARIGVGIPSIANSGAQ